MSSRRLDKRHVETIQPDEGTVRAILVSNSVNPDEDSLDVDALWDFVRRYWLWILAIAFFGSVIGYGVSYLYPKFYRATVLVAPAPDDQPGAGAGGRSAASRFGAIASLAGIDLGNNGGLTTAVVIATLKSQQFLSGFITEEDLLPIMFADRWDAKAQRWQVEKGKPPNMQNAVDYLSRKLLVVSEDRRSGLVTISLEWQDPKLAAEWANKLVTRINVVLGQTAVKDAATKIEYLNRELANATSVEVRQTIFSMIESQMNKRMIASTRPDFVFRVIDPAQPPNLDKRVRPMRLQYALFGGLIAGSFSLLLAFVLNKRRQRAEDTARGAGSDLREVTAPSPRELS